jgi:hypothetical protein
MDINSVLFVMLMWKFPGLNLGSVACNFFMVLFSTGVSIVVSLNLLKPEEKGCGDVPSRPEGKISRTRVMLARLGIWALTGKDLLIRVRSWVL